ncbi:DUF1508 domain-containing protein [Rudanella paleaurantiibacter]|uniref:DUF1508 domain-containing protein n=2 Tax=Rudanella paleaurantiibacter TaxID=2614655 RepID=A0A7J5U2K9_9BACT|nr:DUF1508 domain-containing protein [Rudanella paleaurantiibacter]
MGKFKVFKSTVNQQYFFRFNASNGEQILSSEMYTTKQNCYNGIAAVKSRAPYDSAYLRIDNPLDYRFNMISTNYQVIARSSEGYTTKVNRENAIGVVKNEAPTAPIEDLS